MCVKHVKGWSHGLTHLVVARISEQLPAAHLQERSCVSEGEAYFWGRPLLPYWMSELGAGVGVPG